LKNIKLWLLGERFGLEARYALMIGHWKNLIILITWNICYEGGKDFEVKFLNFVRILTFKPSLVSRHKPERI
jgi:hypothetical protein